MIQNMIKEGKIVPSEVTIKLLQIAMAENENDKFLIDGFPRNEENRAAFEKVFSAGNQGREDDNIDTIGKRFKVFVESPSLPIDAGKPVGEVFESVKGIFSSFSCQGHIFEGLPCELSFDSHQQTWLLFCRILGEDGYHKWLISSISKDGTCHRQGNVIDDGTSTDVTEAQELEHQALIYSYMASGVPIPCDLIFPLRRRFLHDSNASSSSLFFPPQTQLGWNCFQVGFGVKSEDPEPGRCRRTDGKKWRCSKEAFPDSKYCEKHMHRGKNRSRKPEEISFATTSNRSSSPSSNQRSFPANLSISTPDAHHLSYPSPTSSLHPGTSLSFDKGIGQLHLSSGSPSVRDHRRSQEMKGFHAESYENEWGSSCQFGAAVRQNNLGEAKQSSYSLSKEEEEERQRPLRHFFDEWPQRKRDPWMTAGKEENSSCIKTQLSISFPKWQAVTLF
ncbi:hypothetical protein HPP92_005771 [Vanilla planifolia]|uniref:Growth-regulating factor n=1 Tax=Vanilla planifolia TaxID=51239 RepID=A0A835RKV8_VANPL|nr:hypothetical protein HPP92_005771 [Vanilla planifolia]